MFVEFAHAHGLEICRLESGRIRRCPTSEHRRKENGAYLFAGDWGWVQNWETMSEPVYWRDESIVDPLEIERQKARIEQSKTSHLAERARLRAQAASRAEAIIRSAKYEQHAYLDSKGFGNRLGMVWYPDEDTNILVVPMYTGGSLAGCQLIDRDGKKKFLRGQRASGAEHVIGSHGPEIWCEGYATALSIHAALKAVSVPCMVHVCFSAGNLQRMARSGFVVADNDASHTGEQAAAATGLPYYMPDTTGSDFNDFHQAAGTIAAGMALRTFLNAKRARR